MVELKQVEQRDRKIEEFVQEFRRAVRESEYRGRLLAEEFKCNLNKTIWQRLMELECQPGTIEQ